MSIVLFLTSFVFSQSVLLNKAPKLLCLIMEWDLIMFPFPLNTCSFQLTVEMFDYLECELNLFLGGKFKVESRCLNVSKVLSLGSHFGGVGF